MIIFSQVILYAVQLFQAFQFYVLLSLSHQKYHITQRHLSSYGVRKENQKNAAKLLLYKRNQNHKLKEFSQFSSVAQSCPTPCEPWTAAHQASLSISNSQSPPKLMSIELVMPSNHLILCCPLILLPLIFPSIRVFFKWVSSSHQVAKVLEFQLQHQSFQWTLRTDLL